MYVTQGGTLARKSLHSPPRCSVVTDSKEKYGNPRDSRFSRMSVDSAVLTEYQLATPMYRNCIRERALALLRTAVGDPTTNFRPHQWEAIERLLKRERLLVVERTGWGKSSVYFLATRLLRDKEMGC